MSRTLRRGAALVAALGLTVVGLTACSSNSANSAKNDDTPSKPVSLEIVTWDPNETHAKTYNEIADAYIKAHPDQVKSIKFTAITGDYTTGLTTRISGGNVPDIAWILEDSADEFVNSGALYDLAPTLDETKGYDVDDLNPSAMKLWEDGKKIYAYPFSTSPFGVYVNTDMLKAAGQPNPADLVKSGDWTWDKLEQIAAATAKSSGKSGFNIIGFDYTNWDTLSVLWDSFGAAPWNAAGTKCTFTSPEMEDALTWFHKAIFDDGAYPQPGDTVDFFAGNAAMTVGQLSRASGLDGSFNWDYVPLPSGPKGHVNVIGQAGMSVLSKSKNPQIAADFLAYFSNAENAKKLAAYFPPPRTSLLTADILAAANPKMSKEQLQNVVVDGAKDAVNKASHPNFSQINQAAKTELDALWKPDADVDKVAKSVCSAIAPLLKQG